MLLTSDVFWENELVRLWNGLEGPAETVILAGIESGSLALPEAVRQLIDWDFTSRAAISYLETYQLSDIAGINQTTRARTMEIFSKWLGTGEPFPRLVERLAPLFGTTRAEVIAITEVTKLYANGNIITWQSTQVVSGKRWMTAVDERVCPICGPLHGQTVELNGEFGLEPAQVASSPQMIALLGNDYTEQLALQEAGRLLGNFTQRAFPPAHPRCRCWLQPFVDERLVERRIEGVLRG